MQEKLKSKIEGIMSSLDGMEKASPSPFFFTRLQARLEKEKSIWDNISSFVTRPVIAFACICLILLINTVVIFSTASQVDSTDKQNNELATVDEYSQVSSSLYELVNTKP